MMFGERWVMIREVMCNHVTLRNSLRKASLTLQRIRKFGFERLIIVIRD